MTEPTNSHASNKERRVIAKLRSDSDSSRAKDAILENDDLELDAAFCWQALYSRDARFDGRFFVGTVTTGVYCRSTCPIWCGHPTHIRWFRSPAAASTAGFRPCKRCRPDTSPGSSAWYGTCAVVSHSLKLISQGALDEGNLERLAERVGIGSRHLRRLFDQHLGASPLKIARLHRVNVAKSLITETHLPITEIAFSTGFRSIRQFNHSVQTTFGQSPTELRRLHGEAGGSSLESGIVVELPSRSPFSWSSMIQFLSPRATPEVEILEGEIYRRTIEIDNAAGTIEAWDEPGRDRLLMRVLLPRYDGLMQVVRRARRLFDLSTDTVHINQHLGQVPALSQILAGRPGLRLPGAWDRFEIAVRAVLGQQLMAIDSPELAGRLVKALGRPVKASIRGLSYLFPKPETLAGANLLNIGVAPPQAKTIRSLAQALASRKFTFDSSKGLEDAFSRLRTITGLNEDAASYIAMRCFGEPDAFPHKDLALCQAVAADRRPVPPAELLRIFEALRPWRAYAAMHFAAAEQEPFRPARALKSRPTRKSGRSRVAKQKTGRARDPR